MQFGINLLGKKELATTEEKEIVAKFKRTIVVTLLGYTLVVMILIGFQLFLSREKQNISSQASQLEARIKTFQKVETLEVLIKDRIEKSTKIVSSRTHPEIILTKIINAQEEKAAILSIELGKNEEVTLSAESSDAAALESFMDKIKEVLKGEGYSSILLEAVNRTKSGGYSVALVAKK